uniref:Major facilitator superfamily (MFS) profile domain-containing protein n=1 Tax=Panagrolaimus sp. ES5 TaxID=591445 RepID=A0AC34FT50_9BILA
MSMRINLGVAMVCMINATAVQQQHHHSSSHEENAIIHLEPPPSLQSSNSPQCHRIISANETETAIKSGYKGTFTWTTEEQSLLFTASFYGNLLSLAFGGFLINRFGSKQVALVSALGMTATTALMPTAAYLGIYYFFAVKVVFGIFESPIYAALATSLSLWFPPNERSTAASFFTSGSPLASSLGTLISTQLCSSDFLDGWPLIFYFMSIATIAWILIWILFFTNNPKHCRMLSVKEKEYLSKENEGHSHPDGEEKPPLPLANIVSSPATLAVMFATFAHYFTTSLMQNFLPTYSRDVLALDFKSNGAFTSMTFTFKFLSKYILSFTADFLKSKKILTPTISSKVFQSAASFGVATVFIFLTFYIDCTKQSEALFVLAFYGIFAAAANPGYFTSACSFAPMYTGMILSLMEGAGAIGHLAAPFFVGLIVKHGQTNEWSIVFGMIVLVNIVGGFVFLRYGTADIQKWAHPKTSSSNLITLESSKKAERKESQCSLLKKKASELLQCVC